MLYGGRQAWTVCIIDFEDDHNHVLFCFCILMQASHAARTDSYNLFESSTTNFMYIFRDTK